MTLAQLSGSIINVASVAGLVGIADRAAYNASKHGLIVLTRALAAEWGGRGVRVENPTVRRADPDSSGLFLLCGHGNLGWTSCLRCLLLCVACLYDVVGRNSGNRELLENEIVSVLMKTHFGLLV
jgi:hypothetical protein